SYESQANTNNPTDIDDVTIEDDRINPSLNSSSTRTRRSRRSERLLSMEQTKSHTDGGRGGLKLSSANSSYVYTYRSQATLEQAVLPLQATNQTYNSSGGYGSETINYGSWIKSIQALWKKLVRNDTPQVNPITAAASAATTHSRLEIIFFVIGH
ncbi:unnamed protein product, partial [Trichobilharzia regenti]